MDRVSRPQVDWQCLIESVNTESKFLGAIMTKNRKTSDTYRFNGLAGLKPVETAELKALIERFQAKQQDSNDPDDKKWIARWLKRFQQELAKKENAMEQRRIDSNKQRRKIQSESGFDAFEIPASDAH